MQVQRKGLLHYSRKERWLPTYTPRAGHPAEPRSDKFEGRFEASSPGEHSLHRRDHSDRLEEGPHSWHAITLSAGRPDSTSREAVCLLTASFGNTVTVKIPRRFD